MSDLRTPPKLDEEEANTPAPFQEEPEGVDYSTLSPSRSSGERSRDALLRLLDGTIFQYLGLMVLFLVVVDGAFFFFLLIGAQRMCRPRTDCDPRNGWYNISIQILNILFTYMATVSMPWRCTNAIHLLEIFHLLLGKQYLYICIFGDVCVDVYLLNVQAKRSTY